MESWGIFFSQCLSFCLTMNEMHLAFKLIFRSAQRRQFILPRDLEALAMTLNRSRVTRKITQGKVWRHAYALHFAEWHVAMTALAAAMDVFRTLTPAFQCYRGNAIFSLRVLFLQRFYSLSHTFIIRPSPSLFPQFFELSMQLATNSHLFNAHIRSPRARESCAAQRALLQLLLSYHDNRSLLEQNRRSRV